MNLYLTALIAYSIFLMALGLFISRRVKTSSDFLVAGRSFGVGMLFTTFLAANIGAGSTVNATGLGYRYGLSAWWWVGSAGIGGFFLAQFVGPRIWTIAKEHNLSTLGDYLEFRYNKSVKAVIALLLWIGTLALLAAQLIAISTILNVSIGTSKWIFAFQNVPMATRKMKPVGIEISSVVSMNTGRMSGLMPESNRWCCHTKKLSSVTPIIPAAATL